MGVGSVVGWVNGPLSNFQGRFINIDLSALIAQGSASFSPAGANTFSNGPVGWAGGLALSPTPGGLDMSVTWTHATGIIEDEMAQISSLPNPSYDSSPSETPLLDFNTTTSPSYSSTLDSVNLGNVGSLGSAGTRNTVGNLNNVNLGESSFLSTPSAK